LTGGGLISLLLGSAFLLNTGAVDLGIDWRLIAAATIAFGLGVILVLRKAIQVRSSLTSVSALKLLGAIGEARGPLSPEGSVFVAGATWPAVSTSGPLGSGETIRVLAQDGGALQVEAAARSASEPPTTSQPTVPRSPGGDGAEPPDL